MFNCTRSHVLFLDPDAGYVRDSCRKFIKLYVHDPCTFLYMGYISISILTHVHRLKAEWLVLYHDVNRGFPWVVGLWINFIFQYVPNVLL